jgi:hypothetical protein
MLEVTVLLFMGFAIGIILSQILIEDFSTKKMDIDNFA